MGSEMCIRDSRSLADPWKSACDWRQCHAMHLVLNFLAATFAGGIRTYVIILTSSRSADIEDTEVVADGMLPYRGFLLLHHGQAVQHVLASK